MQSSNQPGKISLPFANSGAKQPIPVASQVGVEDGRASYTDGFPPLTRTPLAAGGKPPFGTDMNGILNAITAIQQWQSAGGMFMYDSAMSTSVGGYPKGAFILKADASGFWQSTAENNTSNPDTGGSGWRDFSVASLVTPSGAVQAFAMGTAPAGWLTADGSAISRTTYSALFSAIGTIYGSGDGTTTFNLPDLRGEFVRGVDLGRGADPARTIGTSQKGTAIAFDDSSTGSTVDVARGTLAQVAGDPYNPVSYPGVTLSFVTPGTTAPSLASGAVTRPRNVALLYCVKI